jgi:hypothetical protein
MFFCFVTQGGIRTQKGIERKENHCEWFLARWFKPVAQAQDGRCEAAV